MQTIAEIRHANLQALIEQHGGLMRFAELIDRSHSHVSQLRNRSPRGDGKERSMGSVMARHIERSLGLHSGWMDTPHPPNRVGPDVQITETIRPHIDEIAIDWEDLMGSADLPDEYRVQMPDRSMEPGTPLGTWLVMSRSAPPTPGHGVLVRDAAGILYVRRYVQGTSGRWSAEATNAAYATLDSERDALQVVSVVIGRRTGMM